MSRGLMGAFEAVGLVEGDTPPAPELPPTHHVAVSTAAPPVSAFTSPALSPAVTLDAADTDRLKALEAQVYATPSSYVIFQRVRESLGNTPDLAMVFKVLVAANPGVTPAKVMGDIDGHLGIIATKRTEFDGHIAQARAEKIDGPTGEIADLTRQNEDAQRQIRERTARIATLNQSMQDAQRALADGAARFKLIESQLSAPLLQAKQLLSSLT